MKQIIAMVLACFVTSLSIAQEIETLASEMPGDPGVELKEYVLSQPGDDGLLFLEAGPFAGRNVTVKIKHKNGKKMMERTINVQNGPVVSVFNCSKFPPGAYHIVVSGKQMKKTFDVVMGKDNRSQQ